MDNSVLGGKAKGNKLKLNEAQDNYAEIANERLKNIAQGDNWNPWLAMRQAVKAVNLSGAEGTVEGVDAGEGYVSNLAGRMSDRSDKFDAEAKMAEEYAAEMQKAQNEQRVEEFLKQRGYYKPNFQP